jgi:hypothetical protein
MWYAMYNNTNQRPQAFYDSEVTVVFIAING